MMDRLVLGCGNRPYPGAVNHDRVQFAPHVDVAWDLNVFPWPWEDDSFDEVIAEDLVEHLNDFIQFFDECWRILRRGGRVRVRVPRWDSMNVHIDPTHKRGYHVRSFDYLDPRTHYGKFYGMYTGRKWHIVDIQDGDNIEATLEPLK